MTLTPEAKQEQRDTALANINRWLLRLALPTYTDLERQLSAVTAERDALLALLEEWDGGDYDGQDYLRRVRLALHGARGLRAVGHNAELRGRPLADGPA